MEELSHHCAFCLVPNRPDKSSQAASMLTRAFFYWHGLQRTPANTSAPTVTASGVRTKVSMELSGPDTENFWQVPSHVDDVAEVRENDKEGSHYRMAYPEKRDSVSR